MNKNKPKLKTNKPEPLNKKGVSPNSPLADIFPRDIKYLKVKDVKRGMSKIITEFLKGNYKGEDAKTAAYLFSTYIQIVQHAEYEKRLEAIERVIKR